MLQRAQHFDAGSYPTSDVWARLFGQFGLRLTVPKGQVANIPTSGPVVLVANHPFGILDGLSLGYLLSQVRPDFQIISHNVFQALPSISPYILPIDFAGDRDAAVQNLAARRAAVHHLKGGGALGVFPGGTVSTGRRVWDRPTDPAWRTGTAKILLQSRATVVPVFFSGRNSIGFQIASHIHSNLRLGLLISEFKRRMDGPVGLTIGRPIPPMVWSKYEKKPVRLMAFLREQTYNLSQDKKWPHRLGYDFDKPYRT